MEIDLGSKPEESEETIAGSEPNLGGAFGLIGAILITVGDALSATGIGLQLELDTTEDQLEEQARKAQNKKIKEMQNKIDTLERDMKMMQSTTYALQREVLYLQKTVYFRPQYGPDI